MKMNHTTKFFLLLLLSIPSLKLNSFAQAERKTFCQKNPDARICKSAYDVNREEKEKLEEDCRWRPNTEKCKNKATIEKVRKERLDYCAENPKACAGRR